jgi:hypothetical protein
MKANFTTWFGSAAAALCLVSTVAPQANAGTFTGSDATRAASAAFEAVGTSQLKITLSNTSTGDVAVPIDVLTGVFFQLNYPNLTGLTLDAISATLTAGSQAVYNGAVVSSSSDVSNGWAYNGSTGSRGSGISAAGLGLFGPGDVIGTNSNGVQGLDYGLLSAGDNIATGNIGVTKQTLYKSGVSFLFNVVAPAGASFDINTVVNSISSVGFQYGTATSEPYLNAVAQATGSTGSGSTGSGSTGSGSTGSGSTGSGSTGSGSTGSGSTGSGSTGSGSTDSGSTGSDSTGAGTPVPEPAEIGGVALAALILGTMKLKASKRSNTGLKL